MNDVSIDAVAFDCLGTLFELDRLGDAFDEVRLERRDVGMFVAAMLRDAMALELSGEFAPMSRVAAATLEQLLVEKRGDAPRASIDRVRSAFRELAPDPDARAAVDTAKRAGMRVVALTNGDSDATAELLARAGLAPLFDAAFTIDRVGHWKPHRETYLYAARGLALPPSRVALVARHAWDITGAKRAGLAAVWVGPGTPPAPFATPDARGASLRDAVEDLVRRSKRHARPIEARS